MAELAGVITIVAAIIPVVKGIVGLIGSRLSEPHTPRNAATLRTDIVCVGVILDSLYKRVHQKALSRVLASKLDVTAIWRIAEAQLLFDDLKARLTRAKQYPFNKDETDYYIGEIESFQSFVMLVLAFGPEYFSALEVHMANCSRNVDAIDNLSAITARKLGGGMAVTGQKFRDTFDDVVGKANRLLIDATGNPEQTVVARDWTQLGGSQVESETQIPEGAELVYETLAKLRATGDEEPEQLAAILDEVPSKWLDEQPDKHPAASQLEYVVPRKGSIPKPHVPHVLPERKLYIPDVFASPSEKEDESFLSDAFLKRTVVNPWIAQRKQDEEITPANILTRAQKADEFPDLWSVEENQAWKVRAMDGA